MEIHAIIAITDTELLFLHETSPVSPINLHNFASFNLFNYLTNPCPPFAQVTSESAQFIILYGEVTLIFCHSNASVLFCQKLKDLFIEAFQTAAAESFTPQSSTNNIDLCFDLLRRILQFGRLHEVDSNRLVQSTFFNRKNEFQQEKPTSLMSKMFASEKPPEVEIPESCCTVSESLSVKVLNGKVLLAKCTGKIEVSVTKFTPNINLVQIEAKVPETVSIFSHSSTTTSDQNCYRRFERKITTAGCFELARYEIRNFVKVSPIEVSTKVNSWEKDKLAEVLVQIKSNFPKPYRATSVKIQFKDTPDNLINARLCTDHPTLSLSRETGSIFLGISNLFGQSTFEAAFTVSLSDLSTVEKCFKKISLSYTINDFNNAGVVVDKFKLLTVKRRNIQANRLQRIFCASNNATQIIYK